jgi:hypothetical protein
LATTRGDVLLVHVDADPDHRGILDRRQRHAPVGGEQSAKRDDTDQVPVVVDREDLEAAALGGGLPDLLQGLAHGRRVRERDHTA